MLPLEKYLQKRFSKVLLKNGQRLTLPYFPCWENKHTTMLYIYIPMGRMKTGVNLEIYPIFPFKIIVLIA